MVDHFFPCVVFCWTFCLALVAILSVASWIDWRSMVIPKWLTLPALALGVLANLVRGGWLGATDQKVWVLGPSGAFLGAVDGLLFALAGFALGFTLFFLMWLLNACGAGDVKLFAALGAWLGPGVTVLVLIATLIVVIVLGLGRLILRFFGKGGGSTFRMIGKKGHARAVSRRLTGFSFPLALATTLVLLVLFSGELRLTPLPPTQASEVIR